MTLSQSGLDKLPLRSEAEYRAEKAPVDLLVALEVVTLELEKVWASSGMINPNRHALAARVAIANATPHPANALFHAITGGQK